MTFKYNQECFQADHNLSKTRKLTNEGSLSALQVPTRSRMKPGCLCPALSSHVLKRCIGQHTYASERMIPMIHSGACPDESSLGSCSRLQSAHAHPHPTLPSASGSLGTLPLDRIPLPSLSSGPAEPLSP